MKLDAKSRKPAALPKGVLGPIVMRDTADLKECPENARTHTTGQIEEISRAMDRFGFTVPILVDKADMVVAGHGRLAAARMRGMAQVPTLLMDGLTEAEIRAYRIWDNRSTDLSEWDDSALLAELASLSDELDDLSITGFDADDLKALQDDGGSSGSGDGGGGGAGGGGGSDSHTCPACGHVFQET